jgi:hypothetical protein
MEWAGESALELPRVEPWPEAVEGAALLDELEQVLKRIVVLPQWAAEALALWTVHTCAFELREVTTYVGVESPEKRCGKTTLLTLLAELVNRPVVASNISSPAFFRVIEETRPTLLIDEADTFLATDQLRGILNSGYNRKGAFVVRVRRFGAEGTEQKSEVRDQRSEGGEGWRRGSRLARFSCWCPKAMARIGRFADTLADRCILIRMQRKTSREECGRLRDFELEPLRRKCARFVADHAAEIAAARPEIPPELNDRAADIWEPLLALADLARGEWPARARQAALGLTAAAQESTPIGSLLFDIFLAFRLAEGERIFSRDLAARLNRMEARPWAELRKGKEITELWVAQKLRPYGIQPRTIWIGENHAKGYLEEDFTDVYRRYMSRSEVEAFRAECKTISEQRGNNEPSEVPSLTEDQDVASLP